MSNVGKTALMEAGWIYERNKNSAHKIEAFVNRVNTMTLIRGFRHLLNYDNHDFSLLKKFNRMLIKSNNQSVKLIN
ncbi:MAG: hypothetical protein DRR19_14370 [Candidatus Parabeggiatoa sp. nov. 1]|nr:MAG: hypothetical protein DRR19_14370 [Gammaproteobacteria bacterium]